MKLYNLAADGYINSDASISPFISKHEGDLVVEIIGQDRNVAQSVKLQISVDEALLLISNLSSALYSLKN